MAMTPTTYRKIGLATLIMMTSIFLSRMLGVLRESVLAAMGGAGTAVDAYKTAFIVPEILNHVVAGGFLSITFIPIFARYLSQQDEAGGWRIFSIIMTVFGCLLGLLILLAMLLAPQLIALLAPGRDDPLFTTLTVRMTRIVLPAQFFFFAGGLFMAVQFARERFFLPAMAGLIYNLGIIVGGLTLSGRWGIEGFCWGALAGAFVGSFIVQAIGARKAGMRFKPRLDLRHPDLKRYTLLTLPLIFGLTMLFSTEVFSKLFGSYLPPGGISWIDYAMRILMMLVGFFGQALGVASFPFLSRYAAENRMHEANRVLAAILRYLALLIPLSMLVWVLRMEIVSVLFERMRFSSSDTRMTALALSGMLLGAAAIAAQTVVNRGFYAIQNTWLPAVFSTLTTLASIPLYWAGLKTMGVTGVGLAISMAAIIQVVVVYAVWNRLSGNDLGPQVYAFYGKILLVTLAEGAVLWSAHHLLVQWIAPATFLAALSVIVVIGSLSAVLNGLAAWWFNIAEIRSLAARLKNRIRPSPD